MTPYFARISSMLWPSNLKPSGSSRESHELHTENTTDQVKIYGIKGRTVPRSQSDGEQEGSHIGQSIGDTTQRRTKELENELTLSKQQNRDLEHQVYQYEKSLKTVKDELQKSISDQRQLTELLQTRTSELKGAQAFVMKADAVSGADVIRIVENLNGEIFQAAAFMADSLEWREYPGVQVARESTSVCSEMLFLLRLTHDPMVAQLILQACMVDSCRVVASTWDSMDIQMNFCLQRIYEMVAQKGDSRPFQWHH
jgi:hypothetical protein